MSFFKASSAYTLTPAWKIPKLFVSLSREDASKTLCFTDMPVLSQLSLHWCVVVVRK